MFGIQAINVMLLPWQLLISGERRHSRRSEQPPNLLGRGDNGKLA